MPWNILWPLSTKTTRLSRGNGFGGYSKKSLKGWILPRNALFVVAGIQLISLFGIKTEEGLVRTITIGVVVFVALVFVGLALWTKKKPFAALLTALITYVSLLVLDAVFDPSTLLSGVLIKAGVIIALVAGLRNAKEGEDLKKAFGQDR